jgi:hypothetical protein
MVMSLNTWEQQALNSIKDQLADSAPRLTALLTTFNRLASNEEMPVGEKIHADRRRTNIRPRRKRRHPRHGSVRAHERREYPRQGFQRAALLLWLLTTITLITVALALTRSDSQHTCVAPLLAACVGPLPGTGPPKEAAASQTPQPSRSPRASTSVRIDR